MIDDISPPGSWAKELAARPHTISDVWAALREAEARLSALEAERDALRAASEACSERDAGGHMRDKTHNDGGPAYPSSNAVQLGDAMSNGHPGMTLRDWFAGQALAGMLADTRFDPVFDDGARIAYGFADAMLRQREKQG